MRTRTLSRFAVIFVSVYATSCVYNELPSGFDCTLSNLSISFVSSKDASSCRSIDGETVLLATGGNEPYDFSKGDGIYQTNPVFDRLAPGSYLFTVKDIKGCKQAIQVEIGAEGSNLSATTSSTPDNQCLSNNGTINVSPTGGTTPYVLKIDDGSFGSATSFSNLKNGNHVVIIKDAEDCQREMIVTVPRGNSGISFASTIMPIFEVNCNHSGCHGAGSSGRDWTKFSDVQAKASDIKNRTGNRSMPIGQFSLTQTQIDQIACWVDDGANNN